MTKSAWIQSHSSSLCLYYSPEVRHKTIFAVNIITLHMLSHSLPSLLTSLPLVSWRFPFFLGALALLHNALQWQLPKTFEFSSRNKSDCPQHVFGDIQHHLRKFLHYQLFHLSISSVQIVHCPPVWILSTFSAEAMYSEAQMPVSPSK